MSTDSLSVEEGLQAVCHGTADEVLQAAKTLGIKAASSTQDTQFLEQDGTIRAMLKVLKGPVVPGAYARCYTARERRSEPTRNSSFISMTCRSYERQRF